MKTILMSIKPKSCEKIFNGEETIVVRKTAPKPPFKVVVYCTKQRFPNKKYLYINETSVRSKYGVCDDWLKDDTDTLNINEGTPHQYETYFANGKVIGEFICEKLDTYWYDKDFLNERDDMYFITCGELEGACLTYEELCNYGKGKTLYGLHITDLKIYDKPKELSEFYPPNCNLDEEGLYKVPIYNPPQSWMYVEEEV